MEQIKTRPVVIDGITYMVPKGIGRNRRNKSWQLKVMRQGEQVMSGNFADDTYSGTNEALEAAVNAMKEQAGSISGAASFQLHEHVSLIWASSNRNGRTQITASAYVYDPILKKARTVYLVSARKLVHGEMAGVEDKLCRALAAGIAFKEGIELPLSNGALRGIREQIRHFMTSTDWSDFIKLGKEMADL